MGCVFYLSLVIAVLLMSLFYVRFWVGEVLVYCIVWLYVVCKVSDFWQWVHPGWGFCWICSYGFLLYCIVRFKPTYFLILTHYMLLWPFLILSIDPFPDLSPDFFILFEMSFITDIQPVRCDPSGNPVYYLSHLEACEESMTFWLQLVVKFLLIYSTPISLLLVGFQIKWKFINWRNIFVLHLQQE